MLPDITQYAFDKSVPFLSAPIALGCVCVCSAYLFFFSACWVLFYQDVVLRYPSTDAREAGHRQVSTIGAALHYPSYLERGPDYEAEMRYYHGDTLSPKDKVILLSRSLC